jgi:HK97 gp10 family phage protein
MFSAKVKLVSRIPQVEKNLRQRVEEAVGEAAQATAVIARQLVPVRTGVLRDSITAYRNTNLNWVVGASAPYSSWVELGSSTSPAQPFLRPAAEAVRPQLIKKLSRMKVL